MVQYQIAIEVGTNRSLKALHGGSRSVQSRGTGELRQQIRFAGASHRRQGLRAVNK